jgi:hypothetical protein
MRLKKLLGVSMLAVVLSLASAREAEALVFKDVAAFLQ